MTAPARIESTIPFADIRRDDWITKVDGHPLVPPAKVLGHRSDGAVELETPTPYVPAWFAYPHQADEWTVSRPAPAGATPPRPLTRAQATEAQQMASDSHARRAYRANRLVTDIGAAAIADAVRRKGHAVSAQVHGSVTNALIERGLATRTDQVVQRPSTGAKYPQVVLTDEGRAWLRGAILAGRKFKREER